MSGNPGEWEDKYDNTLYVEHLTKEIEIYVTDGDENLEGQIGAGIHLTPGQARSVAAKLIELADLIENMPSE